MKNLKLTKLSLTAALTILAGVSLANSNNNIQDTAAKIAHYTQYPNTKFSGEMSNKIFRISVYNNKMTIDAVVPRQYLNTAYSTDTILGTPVGNEIDATADNAQLAITVNPNTGAKYVYVGYTKHSANGPNELVLMKAQNPDCLDYTQAAKTACNFQQVNYAPLKNIGSFDLAIASNGNPYIAFDSADSNNRGIQLYVGNDVVNNIWGYQIERDAHTNFPSDAQTNSIHLVLLDRADSDPIKDSYPTIAYVAYTDQQHIKLISSDNFNPVKGLNWKELAAPPTTLENQDTKTFPENNTETQDFSFYPNPQNHGELELHYDNIETQGNDRDEVFCYDSQYNMAPNIKNWTLQLKNNQCYYQPNWH